MKISSPTIAALAFILLVVPSMPGQTNYENYYFGTVAGAAKRGINDGVRSNARFDYPHATAVDSSGNIFVADQENDTIRKITPRGVVTTFAGAPGFSGSADGVGSEARFNAPAGLAFDRSGVLYVADRGNFTIRKITPDAVVTTIAGRAGKSGTQDGQGAAARFRFPNALVIDETGTAYVTDSATIRKITPDAVVTTFAGMPDVYGSTDGTGSEARFYGPSGIALDQEGNLFVSDTLNDTIRKITPAAAVTTFAGQAGVQGHGDGTGAGATFAYPLGMVVDARGTIYVSDEIGNSIRKITPAAVVTTFAGGQGAGFTDGRGAEARFSSPAGLSVNRQGVIYVADTYYSLIRQVNRAGVVRTLAGLAGGAGSEDGAGSAARFFEPNGIASSGDGNLVVVDVFNDTVRQISPAGVVSTLAGLAQQSGSNDGTGSAARFFYPRGVTVDGAGTIYVADTNNHTIRKVTPAGVVSTLAGLAGSPGSADGNGSAARFNFPSGIVAANDGTLFVADTNNETIRQISPAGDVTTLAGRAGAIGSNDGMGATARFHGRILWPWTEPAMSTWPTRRITRSGRSPRMAVVMTFAGLAKRTGSNDGIGSAARFHTPQGVAVDGSGNVYVGDSINNLVRKITPAGVVTTLGGIPSVGRDDSADGIGAAARFDLPTGLVVGSDGTLYLCDLFNFTVRYGYPAP